MNKSLAFVFCFALFCGFASASPAPGLIEDVAAIVKNLATTTYTAFSNSLNIIVSGVSSVLTTTSATAQELVASLQSIPADVLQAASDIKSTTDAYIEEKLNNLNAYIEQQNATAPAELQSVLQSLQDLVNEVPAKISNELIPYVQNVVAQLIESASNIPLPEVDSIAASAEAIIEELKTALSGLGSLPDLSQVEEAITTLPTKLSKKVQAFAQKVNEAIQNSSTSTKPLEGITESIANLLGQVPSILSGVGSTVSEVVSQLAQNAANIVNGIVANVKTALTDLSGKVSGVVAQISSKANEAIQKVSTSVSNLVNNASSAGSSSLPLQGLLTSLGTITRQVAASINTLQTSANTVAQNIQTQVQTLAKNFQTTINGATTNAATALNQAATKINDKITTAINSGKAKAQACAEIAQDTHDAVVQNTTSAISTCAESSQSQANTVLQGVQATTVANLDGVSVLAQELSKCVQLYKGLLNSAATEETKTCLNNLNTNVKASTAESVLTSVRTGLNTAISSLQTNVQTCSNAAIASAKDSFANVEAGLNACIAA